MNPHDTAVYLVTVFACVLVGTVLGGLVGVIGLNCAVDAYERWKRNRQQREDDRRRAAANKWDCVTHQPGESRAEFMRQKGFNP